MVGDKGAARWVAPDLKLMKIITLLAMSLVARGSVIYDPHKTDGPDPSSSAACGCRWSMVKSACELDCDVFDWEWE